MCSTAADAREGVDHHADERAIAQAGERACVDTGEQRPRFFSFKDGGSPHADDVLGPAHGVRRIHGDDVADDEPIKEHAQRGEMLFDRGLRRRHALDVRGDMHRLHRRERLEPTRVAPQRKRGRCAEIGAAGVRVADVRREELQEALRRARVRGEQRRKRLRRSPLRRKALRAVARVFFRRDDRGRFVAGKQRRAHGRRK
jgi:hypothetical protein